MPLKAALLAQRDIIGLASWLAGPFAIADPQAARRNAAVVVLFGHDTAPRP